MQDIPVTPESCRRLVEDDNTGNASGVSLTAPLSARRTWTSNETKALIGFYADRKGEFDIPRKKKQALENVLHDLEASGVLVIFFIKK